MEAGQAAVDDPLRVLHLTVPDEMNRCSHGAYPPLMPEVLLFGATGYTGRLTAQALARRGADFAVAGRDRAKLERLAASTGNPDVRVAQVGDVDALADALADVKVLITCVGPFSELGSTAVEAALKAKVHYIDSTGEGPFIGELIESKAEQAREAG